MLDWIPYGNLILQSYLEYYWILKVIGVTGEVPALQAGSARHGTELLPNETLAVNITLAYFFKGEGMSIFYFVYRIIHYIRQKHLLLLF